MWFLIDTDTDLLLGEDGNSWVLLVMDAKCFESYGDAAEFSQNFGSSVKVEWA